MPDVPLPLPSAPSKWSRCYAVLSAKYRVVTQRRVQPSGESGAIPADFPLLYQTTLADVTVLNRILQRQNMFIGMLNKIPHHHLQRGGFTTATPVTSISPFSLARCLDILQVRTTLGQ